jgi:hypothetical protein
LFSNDILQRPLCKLTCILICFDWYGAEALVWFIVFLSLIILRIRVLNVKKYAKSNLQTDVICFDALPLK